MISSIEESFRAAHIELRPHRPVPAIRVEYFPFAGLNHTVRIRDEKLLVRISDLFVDAPQPVIHALALILLAKLYRKRVDDAHHQTYRAFTLGVEIRQLAQRARIVRGRPPEGCEPRGRYRNLEDSFTRLNAEYFGGLIDRPRLSWSRKRSRRTLGRYDATHHVIFISPIFDSNTVPEYVLDYVMIHEMLHVKHQSRVKHSRVFVHTPEFRADERRFARYNEARQWIRELG